MNSQEFANRFFDDAAPPNGPEGWWSTKPCPVGHENPETDNLTFRDGDKAILLKCFKGCSREDIIEALELAKEDLLLDALTLDELANMKGFQSDYLRGLGVEDIPGAVKIGYRNRDGSPAARSQVRDKSEQRFRWNNERGKTGPYGLWRLDAATAQGRLFIVEGASDCWAGWLHGLPMLGLPGATQSKMLPVKDLADVPGIYIVQEPDEAGAKFVLDVSAQLRRGKYKGLATVIELGDVKDICALHQKFPTVEPLVMGPYGQEPDGLGRFNDAIYEAISRGSAVDLDEATKAAMGRLSQRTKARTLTGREFDDLQMLWEELLAANTPPTIFRYGGSLFKMREDGGLVALDPDRLLHRLITLVDWYKITSAGILAPAKIDARLLRLMLTDDDMKVPKLDRVVRTPVFAASGRLVQTPGYDAQTGIYLTTNDDLDVPPVPANPSDEEVARAVDLISEMIVNFPFQSEADRATVFALLLLPFARNLVKGPTPLHLIEAARPGTGKSLLLEVISTVVLGKPVGAMTEADNEEETRKRITAQLLLEPSFVVFENLNRMMRGGAVAQALTCDTWEDRLLGQNKIVSLPVRCAWIAVANNPSFSEEVADRIVTCRIVADVERPRDRDPKQFKHPNLPGWVRENRDDLVWSCLVLVQRWLAKGRPKGSVVLGSFQSWAETMSGILEAAGIPGLLGNRPRLLESADPIGDARRAFVSYWYEEHGTDTVYAAALIPQAGQADFAQIDPDKKSKDGERVAKSEQVKMGVALSRMVEVVFDLPEQGVRVTVARGTPKQDKGGSRWRLDIKGRLEASQPVPETPPVASMASDGMNGISSRDQKGSREITEPLGPREQMPQMPQDATDAIVEPGPDDPEPDPDDLFPGGGSIVLYSRGEPRPAMCPHGRTRESCYLCRVPVRPLKKASKS